MQAVKLKRLALSIGRGTSPDYDDEGGALFINQACIYWGRLKLKSAKRARETSHPKGSRGSLQRNDVLINSTGTGTLGRAKLFNLEDDQSYFADSHVTIFRPNTKEANPRFITYLMESPEMQDMIYKLCVSGSTNQIELSKERFSNLTVNIMGTQAQEKIADFLDTETAQIDNLIAKQERLLELLEEKRRATITHAVTRGLNPSVELKETNIPWLGQIPTHWKVQRVKDIASIVLGKMVQNEQKKSDEKLKPYLKSRNIQWDGISLSSVDEMWFKPGELEDYRLKEGDIAVSEGGDVGKCIMWRDAYGEMYFQNSVNRVRVKNSDVAKYVYYVFQHLALSQVFMNTVNRVSIAHLTKDKLVTYHIPMPEKDEQQKIAEYLDGEDDKFRKLKQKAQTQITLLRERRTSLISHAVTGKIKV